MKIVHTADLQLGARFDRFGTRVAKRLDDARFETLARVLDLAVKRDADAIILAGDTFEDPMVSDEVLERAVKVLTDHAAVPVFILPGNHDTATGAGAVWARKELAGLPGHVTVMGLETADPRGVEAAAIGGGMLVFSPLRQKKSGVDPTLAFTSMDVVNDGPRIGVSHGSPMVDGQYQADDFPIALDAASRSGLDYLAIGHWHGWREFDGGRMIMPGSPEPDRFDQANAGSVAVVEVPTHGDLPKVERVDVATCRWSRVEVNDADGIGGAVETLADENAMVRVVVKGVVDTAGRAAIKAEVEKLRDRFLLLDLRDETKLRIGEQHLAAILEDHSGVAEVLGDLVQLQALAGQSVIQERGDAALSMTEIRVAAEAAGLAIDELDADLLDQAVALVHEQLSLLEGGGE